MGTVPYGVAIVNWNGREDTLACLDSLAGAEPRPARVVVVDNASQDDSVPALSVWIARHPEAGVTLLESDSNLGFAGACNRAVARLATDPGLTHFFLLNNDTTVDRDCFGELAQAVAEAPRTAILGMTVYEGPAARRAWYAGGTVVRWRAWGRHLRVVPRGSPRVVPVSFVSGCAMLISRGARQALGPLSECYFMYFEDTEYCVRAAAAGLGVGYAPRPVVHHRVASTAERGVVARALAEYRFAKSRALFARRNLRGALRWVAVGYLLAMGFPKSVLRTIRGRPVRAWMAFRGTLAGLLAVEGQRDWLPSNGGQGGDERPVVRQQPVEPI